MPPKISWTLADVTEYTQARAKKFNAATKALSEKHAVKPGTPYDTLPPAVELEFRELNEITEDIGLCLQLAKAGIDVFCDCDNIVGHSK